MIVGGEWLLPISGPPLRNGGVLIRGAVIQQVGDYADLVAADPGEPTEWFEGCVISPGLVNAHTHLCLTVLRDLVPPAPLAQWIPRIAKAVTAMGIDDLAASAAVGALESLAAGVTVVGDIAYGPESPAAAGDVGVAGVFFWEVLGIAAAELRPALVQAEFPFGRDVRTTGRTRRGISPHSPYTSGPTLLQAAWEEARGLGAPFAIHVAESPDESALMHEGGGGFAPLARRMARGFAPPGVSSVAYLDGLGVLDGALAVHCVRLEGGDVATLAAKARGVALCPRSNALLHNGPAPVRELAASGATLAIGTDSAASNADLDLLAEARALREIDPTLSDSRLLSMVTLEGARALGVDDEFGSVDAGKQADLAVFEIGATNDPVRSLIRSGGTGSLQAVMAAGVWRMRRKRHTLPIHAVERAAERARATVAAALERD